VAAVATCGSGGGEVAVINVLSFFGLNLAFRFRKMTYVPDFVAYL